MNFDFYAATATPGANERDIDDFLKKKSLNNFKVPNLAAQIQILAGIGARIPARKDYAVSGHRKYGGGYKSLVHSREKDDGEKRPSPYTEQLITPALEQLRQLGLQHPHPDLSILPRGSWFLQFTFTLAKPWLSKDDEIFYVSDGVNPVRKDKVFKAPIMSAAAWKGLLRWTAMHIRLALKKDELTADRFAMERFVQTLLFGDEQGEEPAGRKGFAKYVRELNPAAQQKYENFLRNYYKVDKDNPLPHHRGRLVFFPTFFNAIDMEVINPHPRKTRAGKQPIYLETVPEGAQGTFSLLYVPLDQVGEDMAGEGSKHLRYLVPAITQLFLVYGFSAKRSSGYGVAQDRIGGLVKTQADKKKLSHLSKLAPEVENVHF